MENLEQQQNLEGNSDIAQHNRFNFQEPRQPNILFNSCFDSGNMSKVIRHSYDQYNIWTACDAQGTDNEGYPKSWFYFQASGFVNRKVTFAIFRAHFLFSLSKKHHIYRPVYRIRYQNNERSEWSRLSHPVLALNLNSEGQLVLKFDFLFTEDYQSVEFSFIYPYPYEQCMKDMRQLKIQYENDKTIFLQEYQLIKSYEKRSINFLMISSHQGKEGTQNIKIVNNQTLKITKFRNNKPIIFISARVHPIQTPSSYCMNGIIKFLLNKEDMRAHLLRKYFVFLLVPMLNPDGVFRGHCRMDILNQNLNRYYSEPDSTKQPSCFGVRKLCEHFNQEKRLFMYLDLHAHPALKGNFIFGNAIYEFIQQVESQLFPKILSQNCINFEFQQCNFSRKNMKAKDRNENETKEGCARVVLYKEFGLVHSYTLQCGYHINTFNNPLQTQKNTANRFSVKYKLNQRGEKIYENNQKMLDEEKHKKFMNISEKPGLFDIFEYTSDPIDDIEDAYYKRELPLYTINTFHNLGRNILITILDVWNKNPYSRISDLGTFRKQIAEKQAKLDRFRKEQAGIKTKQKRIVQLIEEQLYGEWHKRNIFNYIIINKNQKKKKTQTQKKILTCQVIPDISENQNQILSVNNMNSNEQNQADIEESLKIICNPKNHSKEIENKISHDQSLDNKVYSKNIRLSKINFTSNMNYSLQRQKQKQTVKCLLLNRQSIGPVIKISLEADQNKNNKEDSTPGIPKVPKTVTINGGNVRIRNMFMAVNGITAIKK